MFKFDEYPEIKKAYKESTRLTRISYKLSEKIKPDGSGKKESIEATEKSANFDANILALKVFEAFKNIKPTLYNEHKNRFEKWEDVFPEKWEKCNDDQKADLLNLVMEIGYGYYWLPEEYYNKEPRHEGLTDWPTCHTKPYKGY